MNKMNKKQEINRIYDLCANSTYQETEYNGHIISLIDLRNLALDGGYSNDERAYKEMIKSVLVNQYNTKGDY